jgi:hypothetical protein
MPVSETELEAKRRRADHLRAEIRSLRTEGVGSRLEADREVQSVALDREIEQLEQSVLEAVKSGGGSVEDAMAAMERAAEIEKMATPQTEESEEAAEVSPGDARVAVDNLAARADKNEGVNQ